MTNCCVLGCRNRSEYKNGEKLHSFHRFPQDGIKREIWLKAINREGWCPSKYAAICSEHFEEKYINRATHHIKLDPEAIPTLALPHKNGYVSKRSTKKRKSTNDNQYLELKVANLELLEAQNYNEEEEDEDIDEVYIDHAPNNIDVQSYLEANQEHFEYFVHLTDEDKAKEQTVEKEELLKRLKSAENQVEQYKRALSKIRNNLENVNQNFVELQEHYADLSSQLSGEIELSSQLKNENNKLRMQILNMTGKNSLEESILGV